MLLAGAPSGTATRIRSPSIQARSFSGLSTSFTRARSRPIGEVSLASTSMLCVAPARTLTSSASACGSLEPVEGVGMTMIVPRTCFLPSLTR